MAKAVKEKAKEKNEPKKLFKMTKFLMVEKRTNSHVPLKKKKEEKQPEKKVQVEEKSPEKNEQ